MGAVPREFLLLWVLLVRGRSSDERFELRATDPLNSTPLKSVLAVGTVASYVSPVQPLPGVCAPSLPPVPLEFQHPRRSCWEGSRASHGSLFSPPHPRHRQGPERAGGAEGDGKAGGRAPADEVPPHGTPSSDRHSCPRPGPSRGVEPAGLGQEGARPVTACVRQSSGKDLRPAPKLMAEVPGRRPQGRLDRSEPSGGLRTLTVMFQTSGSINSMNVV